MVDVIVERPESSVQVTLAPLRKVSLPSDDEFEKLIGIVLERWPMLHAAGEDWHRFIVQFRAAFRRVRYLSRQSKLDTLRGLGWWTDEAAQWLRDHPPSVVSISGNAFTAAVLAQGNVAHTVGHNYPFDLSFGLLFAGGEVASEDQWREVLATGRLLEPSPSPYSAAPTSPVRVQQLAVGWRR